MLAARCRQHADREAVGVCVRCRASVCRECVTRIDDVIHCARCLAKLATRARPTDDTARSAVTRAVALCVVYGAILGACVWVFARLGAAT